MPARGRESLGRHAGHANGTAPARVDGGLHVCPACESDLVHPTTWERLEPGHWRVSLRCPECEWTTTDVFAQPALERFDAELDRGTEAMVRDYKRILELNLREDIERFAAALEANAILPEDF